MTVNRGRGWRRIGIVLSVIWFVGFGGYLSVGELERAKQSYGRHLDLCSDVMNRLADLPPHIVNQEERAQKYAENLAKYDECRAKASGIFQESWNEAWKETLPVLLAFALGTVGFGWLFGWLMVVVSKVNRRINSISVHVKCM